MFMFGNVVVAVCSLRGFAMRRYFRGRRRTFVCSARYSLELSTCVGCYALIL